MNAFAVVAARTAQGQARVKIAQLLEKRRELEGRCTRLLRAFETTCERCGGSRDEHEIASAWIVLRPLKIATDQVCIGLEAGAILDDPGLVTEIRLSGSGSALQPLTADERQQLETATPSGFAPMDGAGWFDRPMQPPPPTPLPDEPTVASLSAELRELRQRVEQKTPKGGR